MKDSPYHYTECGLDNIYLLNGYKLTKSPRGQCVSIHDLDGLHRAIGLFLVTAKRDLSGEEIRFLRHEMLMSQTTLAQLLGTSEQAVRRWERSKTNIPKSSEHVLRLLYREHTHNQHGKISTLLKQIATLEEEEDHKRFLFKDTGKGWKSAA